MTITATSEDLETTGLFYSHLSRRNEYPFELKDCIESTVSQLRANETSVGKPGMLLGKIQSGKTRTFIGVMALAFDNQYDISVILTKGTRALAQQTLRRMEKEFEEFVSLDELQIFDIMNLPDNLADYELDQKIIIVAKKEINNMNRLHSAFFNQYPNLSQKRVLIIDDEADFASIGFEKQKNETIEIRTIAGSIDEFRRQLNGCAYLQVTATPYSLYLQPEELIVANNSCFEPVRPAFTELVPVPKEYIGGDYYFVESSDEDSAAAYIYNEVVPEELGVLKKPDRRVFKIEEALSSRKISSLRSAIVNFIVGGCIRRLQQSKQHLRPNKYSFIVHTEAGKAAHEWQEDIVSSLIVQLKGAATDNISLFEELIFTSYGNIRQSIDVFNVECQYQVPTFYELLQEVKICLQKGHLMVSKVNSERDVNELLDDSGQLKLRVPLNIFIGGQILDRGITIGNLIGFYYGRNPRTYQQDTVLQHSRMYGYRPLEDLAVTRFYTTRSIYDVMRKIHEFDTELRRAFERGSQDNGVVFIQRDQKDQIIPCSPNKILLSSTTTLKPFKRLLPIGFDTDKKTNIKPIIEDLDNLILGGLPKPDTGEAFLMDLELASNIVEEINSTLVFEEGYQWDFRAFLASMEYLSRNSVNHSNVGKVWAVVRTDRDLTKKRKNGRYQDAPDTPQGVKGELKVARQAANDIPALILLRQNGSEETGWRGSPFWWPVLVAPGNTKTLVFASKSTLE